MNASASDSAHPTTETGADASLLAIAEKLCWWEAPEQALRRRDRFVAQVMVLGNWDDVQAVRNSFGEEAFRAVLRSPPPGVFDARSWNYWHLALGVQPVPPLPTRNIPL